MVSRIVLVSLTMALAACSATQQQPAPAPGSSQVPSAPTQPDAITPAADGSQAVTGLLIRATAYREDGRPRDAEGLLKRAQRIAPRDAQVYLEYARLYDSLGEGGLAASMAERGLLYCEGRSCDELRKLLR